MHSTTKSAEQRHESHLRSIIIPRCTNMIVPVDPVCGIELDKELALVHQYDGKEYFFCCNGCWKIFIKKPRKWKGNV